MNSYSMNLSLAYHQVSWAWEVSSGLALASLHQDCASLQGDCLKQHITSKLMWAYIYTYLTNTSLMWGYTSNVAMLTECGRYNKLNWEGKQLGFNIPTKRSTSRQGSSASFWNSPQSFTLLLDINNTCSKTVTLLGTRPLAARSSKPQAQAERSSLELDQSTLLTFSFERTVMPFNFSTMLYEIHNSSRVSATASWRNGISC